ncbi:hypothetical protein [Mesorhizobium retamae]|uniref:Uncharacterized protein n=1 Tax=Mesorhizobium retamae TaxID=2912854 RepID=A0ABS9QN54_9HYPH|nr:hypothetical protein [Mesorhizobium sp. IRAMC:0171]MCG7508878.1 hypothetical protein [Mesorhizobium sp. IRAMC:0171]
MKSHSYMTRALQARDPRFARILGKLGYQTTAELEAVNQTRRATSIAELRDLYKTIVGKPPFNGWNAKQLREKIAAAQSKG